MGLDEVKAQGGRFRPWTGKGSEINFGFNDSAWWVRVPLQREAGAPSDWLLEIHYGRLQQLNVYPPQGPAVLTGSTRPFESRPYYDSFYVFPLSVSTEPEFVYLRVASRFSLTVPLMLWEPNAYRKKRDAFQGLQFLYHGALLVLLLYGVVIFLALRDRRFLIYAAYITSLSLGMFANNGYGRLLFWTASPGFDGVAQNIFFSMAGISLLELSRRMFFQNDRRLWLHKWLRLSQCAFALAVALSFLHLAVPSLPKPGNQVAMLAGIVLGMVVTIAGVYAISEQRSSVRFVMVSWVAIWLGIGIGTLRAFGLVPSSGLTSYALQVSTVAEVLLIALAMADILRLEQKAQQATQAQALRDKQALLEMSQAGEEKLKRAVQERTARLENSLRIEKDLREQYMRFGSMISHEFRTPLNIIQSQASLIRKEREQGVDQLGRRLEAIRSASLRLTTMFDKWLHNDALNETLEVMEFKPIDVQPWLRSLALANPHLVLNHRLLLALSPAVNQIVADEYHLGMALSNLIDNAAKYSPHNTTITLETQLKPGFAGIAVTDQGPGIPAQMQEKIFAEFFRFAPESHVQGVGLGLSIVKRIAEAHGGHVTLRSAPGQGATFCIWLPPAGPKEKA